MDFILGSGIVGVIASYYLKNYMILARGKGQDNLRIGPKFIMKTDHTVSFLNKINQELKKNNNAPVKYYDINFAYYSDGAFMDQLTETEVAQLIYKATKQNNLDPEAVENFKMNMLNGGNTKFQAYYMDEVFHALTNRENFILRRMFMNINSINTKKHSLEGSNPRIREIKLNFLYNSILNTLPAPLFNSLVTGEAIKKRKESDIIIYIIKSRELYEKMGKYDFVFYLDKDIPYYRMSKIGSSIVAIESKKVFFTRNFIKERHAMLKTIKLPFANIDVNNQPKQRANIKHIGCYANADNSLKVHDVIKMFEEGKC